MDDEILKERFELSLGRLVEWIEETEPGDKDKLGEPDKSGRSEKSGKFGETRDTGAGFDDFLRVQGLLLKLVCEIYEDPKGHATPETNSLLYKDIAGDAYNSSYTEPEYCYKVFGDRKLSSALNWFAANVRDTITAAYERDLWTIVIWLELFLELIGLSDEDDEDMAGALHSMIYYFVHDYDDERMERQIKSLVVYDPDSLIYELVCNKDHKDTRYLYEYGEYITDNELMTAKYLSEMSEDELNDMARTYTEGYKKGFEAAGIDLSKKSVVEIRFPIGFEPMIKMAVKQFDEMGLKVTFRRKTNTSATGVFSTSPNKQYQYDHRFDDALYMVKALSTEKLKYAKKAFEMYSEQANGYAGPAVVEVFGERLFVPVKKKASPGYDASQEKLSVEYKRDFALLQNEYIPGDKRSFTIIAYPVPEIGDQYEDIFKETVRINTLDQVEYGRIHKCIIDTLDQGEYVRVLGKGENRTDMKVSLHKLKDPESMTNFENCLADVNIPLGEVFTSPVLHGTEGTLHVSKVYLNGLRYDDLRLEFTDGMITGYSCGNYEDESAGRRYIKENILHNHDTLPIGEFAIGTNTYAYVMGKKYDIDDKLPILIAEKTGPHFAVGDTCYSMSEDVRVYNPDGKEIIARDNEISILRKEDMSKAYYQCHTDITIPYDELGSISVFTKEGKEIIIIRNGRFVLPGTEALNIPLDNNN